MRENETPELELGKQIKKSVNNGLSAAAKWCYGAISAIAANFTVKGERRRKEVVDDVHSTLLEAEMPNQVEVRVEVYGAGSSESALSFLTAQTYPCADQQGRHVAMIDTKGRQPDVISITPFEGVDPCVDTYKLVALAGYAPLSPNLAVSTKGSQTDQENQQSTASMFALKGWNLGSWLLSLFSDPVALKAYLCHSLGAAVYRNWNTECGSFTVYIADFSKVDCRVGDKTGAFLAGTDGMNIVSGPDARVEQIRYLTMWGVEILDQVREYNLFGKGLVVPTNLSRIEGKTLVFDKENVSKGNLLVLDLANIKSDCKKQIETLVKDHGIIKVTPRGPEGSIKDFLWSVTKISSEEVSSTTYQHVANMFVEDSEKLKDLLKSYQPPSMRGQTSRAGKIVSDCLSVTFDVPHINTSLLTGDRSVNRVLSDVLAYLPHMKMRKCVMSNLVSPGEAVAHGLKDVDDQDATEFVFARNPCLLPNSLKVLKKVDNELLSSIFDIDSCGELLVFISPRDASDAQADDDGDSVACEPDRTYCQLIKEHQAFVSNSIFRVAPKIELDKKARISYEKMDSMGKISSNCQNNTDYVRLCVLQPEQPLVGLGSDMAVNTIRAIQWVKVTDINAVPAALMSIGSYKSIINDILATNSYCWVPTEATCHHLFSWLCLVFVTQTAIDWKKRMYSLCKLEMLALPFKLNPHTSLYCLANNQMKLSKVGSKDTVNSDFAKITTDILAEIRRNPGERYVIKQDDAGDGVVYGNYILAKELLDGTGWSKETFGKRFDASVTDLWDINGLWTIESLGVVGTTLGKGISLKWKRYAKSGLKLSRDVTKFTIIDEFSKFHAECSSQSVVKHLIGKTLAGSLSRPSVLEEYIYEYNTVHFLLDSWQKVIDNDSEFNKEYQEVKARISQIGVGLKAGLDISSRRIKGWVAKEKIRFDSIGSFKYFCLLAGEGGLDNMVIRHLIKVFESQLDNQIQEQEAFEEQIMDALDKWIWMGWRAAFAIATGQNMIKVAFPNVGDYSLFDKPTSEMFKALREKDFEGTNPASRILKTWGQATNQATFTGQTLFVRLMNILARGTSENLKQSENLKIFVDKKSVIESALRTNSLEAVLTPVIEKYKDSPQLDVLMEIVERNIARTLRAVRLLSNLPSKEDRFKDFYEDDGPNAAYISCFSASGNLPNAIERIIMSKGWAPPLVLLQKNIAKSLPKLEFARNGFELVKKDKSGESTSLPINCTVISKSISGGSAAWSVQDFERYTRGCRLTYPQEGVLDQQKLNEIARKQS